MSPLFSSTISKASRIEINIPESVLKTLCISGYSCVSNGSKQLYERGSQDILTLSLPLRAGGAEIITKEEFVKANAKGEKSENICEELNAAFLSGIKGVLKILRRTLDTDLPISVHPNFQTAPPINKVCSKIM